jgi:hypothetical protein
LLFSLSFFCLFCKDLNSNSSGFIYFLRERESKEEREKSKSVAEQGRLIERDLIDFIVKGY